MSTRFSAGTVRWAAGWVGLTIACAPLAGGGPVMPNEPAPSAAASNIDPYLTDAEPRSDRTRALSARGLIAVHIYTEPLARPVLAHAVRGDAASTLRRQTTIGDLGLLAIETTPEAARRLATMPGVRWVERAPDPTPRNGTLRQIVQTGELSGAPYDNAGLTGAGQIVGVIDQPLDWDHCAFVDTVPIGPTHRKIVAYNASLGGVSAHGTHVCGTLAGDSDASPDLRGVAPDARLAFSTIPAFDESTFYERLETHAAQGAFIHSNSWGDEQSEAYGGLARAIDAFCWLNDAHLIVTASSNQGVIKTPENAKSTLAVSASLDAPNQYRFCVGPTGPTSDGRRKPELVAPGCSIFSAYPFGAGCPTVFSTGTSMATPAVAGAAAIARQYFTEGWHPTGEPNPANAFQPTGPLLKATLIAGAADLTGEPGWPGEREGWGRVGLAGSLPIGTNGPVRLVTQQRWNNAAGDEPAVSQGDTHTIRFDVVDPSRPVRIVLCWHDAPGAFGAADPVMNDLDLVVTAPGGSVYTGNAIDQATGASITADQGGALPDTRNTTEVIALAAPEPGVHTVTISGAAVRVGRQGYGLAIVGVVQPAAASSCGAADLASPFGVLDLADITAFVAAFTTQGPDADLNPDGVFDLSDITRFVTAFGAGCS